jgi:transcriptional regulator with XRE-family HTH domain
VITLAFPDKLKYLRIKLNLTQKELADKLGVSQSSINYWEKGQRIPSIEAVAKISDFFDITIESLLSSDDKLIKQNPVSMLTGTFFNQNDNVADIHFSTDEYTIDELNQIWQFAHFIKNQRKI